MLELAEPDKYFLFHCDHSKNNSQRWFARFFIMKTPTYPTQQTVTNQGTLCLVIN